ncbi:hypothetical protein QBC43DRAFT_326350 [Cladorrhinum sp. PSN259]|nr:hypothetical protein QBC43DRAFT_326350 [Cladorrhinum sp. PSN259]
MLKSIPLIILISNYALAEPPQCYYITSKPVPKDSGIVPCDPSATGTDTGLLPGGSGTTHSSCCNQEKGDVCLSTGLCLNTSGKTPNNLLWINGCTDPTWRDPACPQYCNPAPNSTGHPNAYFRLKFCSDTTFCCPGAYGNNEAECCRNSFTLERTVGTFVRVLGSSTTSSTSQGTVGPSGSSTSEPIGDGNDGKGGEGGGGGGTNVTAAAVTGGVLGSLLLGVSAALVVVLIQKRRLQKVWDEKSREHVMNIGTGTKYDGQGAYYHGVGGVDSPSAYQAQLSQLGGDEFRVSELPTGETRIGQLP